MYWQYTAQIQLYPTFDLVHGCHTQPLTNKIKMQVDQIQEKVKKEVIKSLVMSIHQMNGLESVNRASPPQSPIAALTINPPSSQKHRKVD